MSHKPHPLQMRLARLIGRTESCWGLGRDSFALFAAISYYVSTCHHAVCVRRALALFGDAKQAMGEGKSGPVETGLTGPVATALRLLKHAFREYAAHEEKRELVIIHCKNIWVTSTIFWWSQLHAWTLCMWYITNFKEGYQSHSESECSWEASPFVKLVSPFRRLIAFLVRLVFLWSYTSLPGGVPGCMAVVEMPGV